ncbi:carbohydrate binding protein with CBM9 domain [Mucilaginibacter yixingensis]|uniref:Carbohydrate binding protein with CBM9 domain n=1 Tax=Mucilaginibacter yixingensis TaxID=1295612 RepID=A0A2T5JFD1_9SPHI|nr:sugar-binding protein [Mucilaginibacter yixingensis]PTR01148.1 carbohydrate binding protein with CBM9 domain [Mucilaginibacter yixingensis]
MVVKNNLKLSVIAGFAIFLLSGCKEKEGIRSCLKNNAYKNAVIDKKFFAAEPVAQLINMPALTSLDTTFNLQEATRLHIYGVGEMDIELSQQPTSYLYKSDDIELFFNHATSGSQQSFAYVFNWKDTPHHVDSISYKLKNAFFDARYIERGGVYYSLVRVPYKELVSTPSLDKQSLNFDIGIGDNDNGLSKKAKLAWNSAVDPMLSSNTRGQLVFATNKKLADSAHRMISYFHADLNPLNAASWAHIPNYYITKLVYGHVKDTNDLSSSVQTYWDAQNINFLFRIKDAQKNQASLSNILRNPNMHDLGWIEDDKGKTVWTMNILYTRHAGGANKNRQIDTVISLKPGHYHLKYLTDESHSWNNWDDQPPSTPFYGIVVYKDI